MDMTLSMFNPDPSYKQRNQCAPTQIFNNSWRNETAICDVHDPTSYNFGGICGNAGLFSNIFDLRRFMAMMMNKGVYVNN